MQHLDDGTLQEWLDRDRSGIEGARAQEVTRHVAGCAPCRARAAELRALTEVTENLLTPAPMAGGGEPDFDDVLARARRRPRSRPREIVRLGRVATVALALGAGWLTNELVRSEGVTSNAEPGVTSAPPAAADAAQAPASEPTRAEAAVTPPPAAIEPAPEYRATTEEPAAGRVADAIVVPPPSRPTIPVQAADAAPSVPLAEVVAPPVAALARAEPRSPRVLTGRVTDDAGRPLAGAQVYVADSNIGALTNSDGTYMLLLKGRAVDTTSVLRVDLIGYGSEARALAVATQDVLTTDFSLTQQALTLESVVVTGSASPTERRSIGNSVASSSGGAARPGVEAARWRPSSRSEAEALAGFALLVMPGVPLSSIRVRHVDDRWEVRVVQQLPSGDELTLTETRGSPVLDDGTGGDGRAFATVLRGALSISASAALPLDSLHSLLERVR